MKLTRLAKIETLISTLKDKLRPRLPPLLRWASREEYAATSKGLTRHEDGAVSIALAWPEDLREDPPYGPHDYSKVEGGNGK